MWSYIIILTLKSTIYLLKYFISIFNYIFTCVINADSSEQFFCFFFVEVVSVLFPETSTTLGKMWGVKREKMSLVSQKVSKENRY